MNQSTFTCYLVEKNQEGVHGAISQQPLDHLPEGEVLIRVAFSSLNYKDALSATGNPGVTRNFPHVPGIDAAGQVVESSSSDFSAGDEVLVTSYDLGVSHWGGWAEYVRVPAKWVVALPEGLSPRQSMIYGTAGLTAAMCVQALQKHDVQPDSGEVVVTGASGGVGSLAVMLLAQLGYQVTAVTGKTTLHDRLLKWGAKSVIERSAVDDTSGKPLLKTRWAGAVDTVGGNTLATLLRSTNNGGCVAACGLVGGVELPITVFPFILRGVTLAGIDSAYYPKKLRSEIWQKLARSWKLDELEEIATEIDLSQIDQHVQKILQGEIVGRVIVSPTRE